MKMIVSAFFAAYLLLLSGCSGALFGLIKDRPFDIDEFDYYGDPVIISCVYSENQTAFYQEKFTGNTEIPADLLYHLNNGKPLSLYFDGIASRLKANGSTFKFAKEWFHASESNICYVTYANEKLPDNFFEVFFHAREMVKSHRLQFTAKLARDLVLELRDQCFEDETPGCLKDMSQLTMLGFSFGAHVASQTCRDLFKCTGEKVGKLIGLDPAGVALTLKRFNQAFIQQGDAAYVQIIHTDGKAGTILQTGDVDIYVDAPEVGFFYKHTLAVYIHMAIAMKKLLVIAEKDGTGRIVPMGYFKNHYSPEKEKCAKPDEVFVGVYSVLHESKRGKSFKISFHGFRTKILRRSIEHVVRAQM